MTLLNVCFTNNCIIYNFALHNIVKITSCIHTNTIHTIKKIIKKTQVYSTAKKTNAYRNVPVSGLTDGKKTPGPHLHIKLTPFETKKKSQPLIFFVSQSPLIFFFVCAYLCLFSYPLSHDVDA